MKVGFHCQAPSKWIKPLSARPQGELSDFYVLYPSVTMRYRRCACYPDWL